MNKARILIVEDEAIVARDLSGQLMDLGYEPAGPAANEGDALALAEQSHPDLVLMDIHLKGAADGIAAAQAIRERFALPVVFISAYLEESVLDRAKAAQPFGYVSKPFQANELRMVIDLALAKHQVETETRRAFEEQAAILRTALDGFWMVDLQGRVLEVNDAYCRMTGYTRAELLHRSMADLEADRNTDQIAANIESVQQSGCARFERRHRRKDGRFIDVEVSVNYLPSSGGRMVCFLRDITERKRVEETLRQSEWLLNKSQALAQVGSWELDLATHQLKWSDEVYRMFGRCPQSFVATYEAFLEAVHPDDRAVVGDAYSRSVREGGEAYQIEHRIVRQDTGEVRVVHEKCEHVKDATGQIVRSVGMVQDITERRRVEAALAHSHDLMRYIIEHNRSAVAVHDRDLKYVYVSQRYLQDYQVKEHDVIGKHHYDVFPDLPQKWREVHRKALAGQISSAEDDPYVRQDGTVDWTRWECRPWYGADGAIGGIIVYTEVITERKRVEEALRASLRETESLLKEIHHRVKNNLQVISSLLRLQSGQIDNPIAKAALQDMHHRVRSMALIHEHLYRSESLAQVDLAAYLKQLCTQLLHAQVARPGAIQFHLNLVAVGLEIDQAIPCGLLVNELISNAIQHAFPEGRTGEVRVELQPVPSGPGLCLRVADNGVGLPEDFDLKKLTSLGLRLVRDLARQLDGELEVTRGAGTVFQVVFTPHLLGPVGGNALRCAEVPGSG